MSTEFAVGETVAIESGYRNTEYLLVQIVRETPTQWVLENDTRINKKDGSIVGQKYRKAYKVTKQLEDVVERTRLVRNIYSQIYDLYRESNYIKNHNIKELTEILESLSDIRTKLQRNEK
jgi:hypothetical protein